MESTRRSFLAALGVSPLATQGLLTTAPRPATAAFETTPVEILRESLEALGLEVEIDAERGSIQMLEPAVL